MIFYDSEYECVWVVLLSVWLATLLCCSSVFHIYILGNARRLHKHIIMHWKWISIRLLLPVDSIYILFKILIMKIKLNIVSSHYLNNMQ